MKVRFLRLSFFVWLAVPLLAFGIYAIWGLPHIIWSYSWRDNGTYDPLAERYYTRCTFVGPYGAITVHPTNGECGWIRFAKKRTER